MFSISKKTNAIFFLLVGVGFWSINAAIARAYAMEIPPVILSLFRWGGAAAIIAIPAFRHVKEWVVEFKTSPWQFLTLAFLSVTIFNTLQYKAGETTASININLIITICPPLTFILSFLINRDKISLRGMLGLVIAAIGTVTVLARGNIANIFSLHFIEGDLVMLVGITAWGLYTVLLKRFNMQSKPLVQLGLMIWLGWLMLIVIYVALPVNTDYTFQISHLYVFAYLWIFPTIVSVLCWMHGVRVLGAGAASFALYASPIYGTLIGTLFLDETVRWFHLLGGLLILLGFYLNFKNK